MARGPSIPKISPPRIQTAQARRLELAAGHVSAEVFERLVDAVADYAIFVIDPEGRIASWNEGAKRIKGYATRDVLGKSIRIFYTPEDARAGRHEKLLGIARREGRVEDEGWRVRADGKRFWARVVLTRIDDADGQHLGFAKVTQDLSERREAERRFRLLVESVQDYAIFPLDPTGIVTGWNAGAERSKGWTAGEIIGKHFSTFYTPEDIAAKKPENELATARATGRVEDEGWRVRKDGTRIWTNVVITAMFEGDELVGFSKITRDLSERRKLEQSQESARLKDEFLATVSHELRTPIHSVMGWLEILRRPGLDDAARERAFQAVERNARAEARIIEDLFDVSRITTGKLRVDLSHVDVRSVVDAAVDVVGPGAAAKGLKLTVHHGTQMPGVAGDRDRLVQVVWNLLTNSVKFTPAGGSIKVATFLRDGQVGIDVVDDGRGIPAELLPLIFDRFRQGDASTTRTVGGLGVGLTIARHLVELHGGTIDAESKGLNQGATFRVTIPAWRGSAARAATGRKARKSRR